MFHTDGRTCQVLHVAYIILHIALISSLVITRDIAGTRDRASLASPRSSKTKVFLGRAQGYARS